ncbi:MAG TPA: type II toxin-antitoxin system VapC family toxin [Burkholderiales bacterium]|jgi:predicted nucleic acid-binding protein|nr:type II toxin-antitoxin system VapC family toxin [Burkholderiales bacterium]
MAFVLDCSVTLPWFLEDERTEFTDSLLFSVKTTEYWVPAIWCLEFPNALLVAERRKRIDRGRRLEALDQVARLLVRVDNEPIVMKAVSGIAERHDLSTYDAAYLELAVRLSAGLITLDRTLAQAASLEGIAVQAPGRSTASQARKRYAARAA